jgi:hypothetical protein
MEISRSTVQAERLICNNSSVGTVAKQIASETWGPADRPFKGLHLQASETNDGMLFIGTQAVTIETGYPLKPGESIDLKTDGPDKLFIVGSQAGQRYAYWIL